MPTWFLRPTWDMLLHPLPVACSLTIALWTDTQPLQTPSNPFSSSGFPFLTALCPSHPAFIFRALSVPTEAQKSCVHLGARKGGAAETLPSVCLSPLHGISRQTPSLFCASLLCSVPAALWQRAGWREPVALSSPWLTATYLPRQPRRKVPVGCWSSLWAQRKVLALLFAFSTFRCLSLGQKGEGV